MILEDNAYRLRVQDFFGILSSVSIGGFRKALRIVQSRERVISKWQVFNLAFFLLMVYPKTRKKIRRFFEVLDIRKVVLDEIDMYWCLQRPDYDFMGLSYESRKDIKSREDKGEDLLKELCYSKQQIT